MALDILQAARRDAQNIITRGGFGVDAILTTPSGDKTLLLNGIGSKHHLSFNSDGMPESSKQAHFTVSESLLSIAEYPVRNALEEIDLKKHRLSYKDSSDVLKHYVVKDHYPDETLGLIVLILGDWE